MDHKQRNLTIINSNFEPMDGAEIDVDTEILGITMMPKEQQVKITPRPAARLLKKFQPQPNILEL